MKTSTMLACLALLATQARLSADIQLGAPGCPVGTKTATKVPFKEDYTICNAYRFVFAGIEAKGDTLGDRGKSVIKGNGGQFHLKATVSAETSKTCNNNSNSGCNNNSNSGCNNSNSKTSWNYNYYGCTGSSSGCNSNSSCSSGSGSNCGTERCGQIEFRNVQEYNSAPLQTLLVTPAAVYRAGSTPIDVNIVWQGEGNANKPNGFFNIIGEYQKDPPIPVGKLTFAAGDLLLSAAGTQTDGVATITRE